MRCMLQLVRSLAGINQDVCSRSSCDLTFSDNQYYIDQTLDAIMSAGNKKKEAKEATIFSVIQSALVAHHGVAGVEVKAKVKVSYLALSEVHLLNAGTAQALVVSVCSDWLEIEELKTELESRKDDAGLTSADWKRHPLLFEVTALFVGDSTTIFPARPSIRPDTPEPEVEEPANQQVEAAPSTHREGYLAMQRFVRKAYILDEADDGEEYEDEEEESIETAEHKAFIDDGPIRSICSLEFIEVLDKQLEEGSDGFIVKTGLLQNLCIAPFLETLKSVAKDDADLAKSERLISRTIGLALEALCDGSRGARDLWKNVSTFQNRFDALPTDPMLRLISSKRKL